VCCIGGYVSLSLCVCVCVNSRVIKRPWRSRWAVTPRLKMCIVSIELGLEMAVRGVDIESVSPLTFLLIQHVRQICCD
jgi:hypothetical protein